MKKIKLDKYEQEIIDLFEKEDIKSIPNVNKAIDKYESFAKYTLQKKDKLPNTNIPYSQEHKIRNS